MLCPECGENLKDNAQVCKNCGVQIDPEIVKDSQPQKVTLKAKILFAAIFAVVLIVAITLIAALISANKGQNTAKKLAAGIGDPIDKVSGDIDFSLTKQSSFEVLNNLTQFTYVCTADDEINVEGVNIPEWAVYCVTDSEDELVCVKFYDFTKLEDSWKGEEESEPIDLSDVEEGMDYSDVKDYIDLKPYIITYYDDSTVYEYKYYYEDVEKNQTCHLIKATFNSSEELVDIQTYESDFAQFIFGSFDMLSE